jgi:hypothetical protein
MGLPYQTEDYNEGGGGGAASTVNDLRWYELLYII